MVISLYLNKDGYSTIKFGSWDKNGLADPNGLKIYQTVDLSRWSLKATSAQFGDSQPLLFN